MTGEHRWDDRGPCNGPRDCVGTERGCSACDPGWDLSQPHQRVIHSGPETKFCVLCLSGEHERVTEEAGRG